MNTSKFISGYLNSNTQRAFAEEEEVPKEKESSPNVALLKKVQRLVFGPSVTDLAEAKTRLASLIDSLDDDDVQDAKKKNTPVA
jgi:hypothetical protein